MKTSFIRKFAFATFAFTALAAQAQPAQNEFTDPTSIVSSKTRAEVRQELVKARQEGVYAQIDGVYPTAASQSAAVSRAHVLAELAKAKLAAKHQPVDATTL